MDANEHSIPAEAQLERKPRLNARIRGLVLLAAGLALAYWQIRLPLNAVRLGLSSVLTSTMLLGLAVLLPAMGLALLVGGERLERRLEAAFKFDPQNLDVKTTAWLIISAIPLGLFFLWIQSKLTEQGFH